LLTISRPKGVDILAVQSFRDGTFLYDPQWLLVYLNMHLSTRTCRSRGEVCGVHMESFWIGKASSLGDLGRLIAQDHSVPPKEGHIQRKTCSADCYMCSNRKRCCVEQHEAWTSLGRMGEACQDSRPHSVSNDLCTRRGRTDNFRWAEPAIIVGRASTAIYSTRLG
jgi:hypothetical protein